MALSSLAPSIALEPVRRPPLVSAGELMLGAWMFYQRHARIFIGISTVPTAVSLVALLLEESPLPIAAIAFLLSGIATLLGRLAFIATVSERGAPAGGVTGAYQHAVAFFGPFLWISILAGIAILGGMVLFVLPGILLSVWLSFPAYALVGGHKTGLAALVASWQAVRGSWLSVAWRFLAFAVMIAALGILISIIASIAGRMAFASLKEAPAMILPLTQIVFFNAIALPLGVIFSWRLWQDLARAHTAREPRVAKRLRGRLVALIALGIAGALVWFALGQPKFFEFPGAWSFHPASRGAASVLLGGGMPIDIIQSIR
ncbi:hypothetical protein C4552_03810 [Candidatus Parcubacteria bacterium]|nr:MAG: hypothetical protein C4552_03810 [Candidatus Parcubacteria bacterium]